MFGDKTTLKQSGNNNLAIQNSEVTVIVSIFDEINRLSKAGKWDEVIQLMNEAKDLIGTKHPLYPHYRYKPVQFGNTTVLAHEPLTTDAVEKYPLSYRGNFTLSKEKMKAYKNFSELIEDAYFNQQEIEINMTSITAWIGDQPVDTPNLNETLTEGKWVIPPRPLPKPILLKFYIKGQPETTILDYLEMSISGSENYFVFIDNSRQSSSKLLVSLKLPIKDKSKSNTAKINVKIREEFRNNVDSNRILLRFLKLATGEHQAFAFKNLESNEDFLVAPNFSFEGNTENLEKDLRFIERLYALEKHFNLTFVIPDSVSKEEWETIDILEHVMKKKPIVNSLRNLTAEIRDKQTIINIIDTFESRNNEIGALFEQSGLEARFELFGEAIPIEKIQSEYRSLKINGLERLKQKVELMDEGEIIKITFLPGKDSSYQETYVLK
ncbi:hypothetical protein [Bacillus sp. FJAT-27245]|uniref:hypothetical protein n=1 Tax=Bacillus sp. FJAT-27245 TaxID=1684144 RepID=UPI0006A7798F|nr:hypothetical protein [Bacillus sp. FJAT-27245]